MPFKRTVEIGRGALVNFGPDAGSLVVISDVLDLKVDIPRLAKKAVLKKAMEEADVENKFAASSWGQKLARREAKANMTDFDRHCAAVKKMKRSASVRKAFNKMKKSA